ncbi:MAG: phosphopantetheine-binding protein [Bacteriovorax sp.]|jgi:acyl carrier protein
MSKDDIKLIFQESLKQVAPEISFEKINLDIPLRDQIEIDSLDLYNIIVSLQKKTGVYIPDSKLAELTNLNELISYVFAQIKT